MRDIEEIQALANLFFVRRCKSDTATRSVCKFVRKFYQFAMNCAPATPFTDGGAIVSITRRLSSLAKRGPTAPRVGRYALRVSGESLGAEFPINCPLIIAVSKTPKTKTAKHARLSLLNLLST